MTEGRSRARIRLAAEQAGWELDRSGLTDIYRKGSRYVRVHYDLHDRVVTAARQAGSVGGRTISGRGKAERIMRLFALPRWTTTD